jgi:hypothetical protein
MAARHMAAVKLEIPHGAGRQLPERQAGMGVLLATNYSEPFSF